MSRSRKLLYAGLTAVALGGLLAWAFAPRPLQVELATVVSGAFETSIEEDGRTRVYERYVITAPLSGRLARMRLREGDRVKAGDVVALLTPSLAPLQDARSLQELNARVEAADAMLTRAAVRIDAARVGLRQARNELERSEQLISRKFVSASKLESDRLAVLAASKAVDSAVQEQHVAEHELDQARAALSTVQGSQSNRRDGGPAASTPPAEFEVRAPIDGSILRVLQPSETALTLGTPLLEIADTGKLEIVAELLTTDALQAQPGTPVRIERWGGPTTLVGQVRRVEPGAFTKVSALGVEEQRVNVLIDLTSPPEQWSGLGDGYRVSVHIVTLALPEVLKVPVSAVFPSGAEAHTMATFVVDNGHARLQPVDVGARNGNEAWIRAGLAAGDRVIIYPGDAVRDGARVEMRELR